MWTVTKTIELRSFLSFRQSSENLNYDQTFTTKFPIQFHQKLFLPVRKTGKSSRQCLCANIELVSVVKKSACLITWLILISYPARPKATTAHLSTLSLPTLSGYPTSYQIIVIYNHNKAIKIFEICSIWHNFLKHRVQHVNSVWVLFIICKR